MTEQIHTEDDPQVVDLLLETRYLPDEHAFMYSWSVEGYSGAQAGFIFTSDDPERAALLLRTLFTPEAIASVRQGTEDLLDKMDAEAAQ
jgi:hypothetical protein